MANCLGRLMSYLDQHHMPFFIIYASHNVFLHSTSNALVERVKVVEEDY